MPDELRAAWIQAQQANAGARYAFAKREHAFTAVAPSMPLVATADAEGLELEVGQQRVTLSLATLRRGDTVQTVNRVEPEHEGNRISYARGGLVERWLHGPLGFEQVIEIGTRPHGSGELVLESEAIGDLSPELGRDRVRFVDGEGHARLEYGELYVFDAAGARLPARLEVREERVQIVVADGDAAYPVTVDPLVWVQQAKLVAADGASEDWFGYAAAISNDTAVVGAVLDDVGTAVGRGSAYVFQRSGTTWTQQAQLLAADGAADDCFGSSVAVSGDTALIGAFLDQVGANDAQGSVYVFQRTGASWAQQVKLIASDGAASDQFGVSVALSGDTALVGADRDSVGAISYQGSAYVFQRTGTTWAQQAKLVASDGASDDHFGASVALSGNTALVGAYGDNLGVNAEQGSAYVFQRTGTTWVQQAKLIASDGASPDEFGRSVALSADTALVGARMANVGTITAQGSGYVFQRTGTAWAQQAKLLASDGASGDFFGGSVALSGNTALISAHGDDVGANSSQGSAYVFQRTGAAWAQQTKLIASDGDPYDGFGYFSVALSSDAALIGSPFVDSASNANQGAAYVFKYGKTNGDACAASSECTSANCVDGVCCNTTCGNGSLTDCRACSVAAGALVDGTCAATVAGTICRPAAGLCDVAETCNGTATTCPSNIVVPAGLTCRVSAGACDVAEACNGTNAACPADAFQSSSTECRAQAGVCDVAESCTGASAACPADAFQPASIECRASVGVCDLAEQCTGTEAACPADALAPSSTECRASAGVCDVAELCTGTLANCPPDAFEPATSQCRPGAGACDIPETCTGASAACPPDTLVPAGLVCRVAKDTCDADESCDGATPSCPPDGVSPDGTACTNGTCTAGACVSGSGGAAGTGGSAGASGGGAAGSIAGAGGAESGGAAGTATGANGSPESDDAGGCGCETPGRSRRPVGALWLLVVAALVRRRRAPSLSALRT
jgi:MYXO-CTERM domain-containing protein